MVVGLATTLAVVVPLKSVDGDHEYDKVPLLLSVVTDKFAEEPLHIVWFGIELSLTLGEFTVTVRFSEAVAVHEPSVAVTMTV